MGIYFRPTSMQQAVAALAEHRLTVLAGGTDFYPARVGRTLDEDILDVTAVAELRNVRNLGTYWRIGAATTWTELIEADLPPLFDGLKLAAREIGGVQIQNAGTIGGNLCNASPAADGVPALLALDASLELADAHGVHALPLAAFIRGNRRTALAADQIVAAICVPRPRHAAVGHFLKLGARRYLVISIAMASGVLEIADGRIAAARVAVGACSEVACRLPLLEAALTGCLLSDDLAAHVAPSQLGPLAPIDDVRASGVYRRDAALEVLRRLVDDLGRRAREV